MDAIPWQQPGPAEVAVIAEALKQHQREQNERDNRRELWQRK